METPKYYRRIMSAFDPLIYGNRDIYELELKKSLLSYEKLYHHFDEFISYVDRIIDDENSEEYCEEIWSLGGSNLIAEPGQYRAALKDKRNFIAGLKREVEGSRQGSRYPSLGA